MSWYERYRQRADKARDYDERFARDEQQRPLGAKPYSEISSWDKWPTDVRVLLRHWNEQRRLSFRGGSFSQLRLPGQERLSFAGGKIEHLNSQAVFRCTRCQAPTETHPYGRAVLDGQPYCDDCLLALARDWQRGLVTAGRAFDEVCCLLKLPYDELAQALALNPKTARRWLSGHEPAAKDARDIFQLHAVLVALSKRLGARDARHFVKDRFSLVLERDFEELANRAEHIIFPHDNHPRRLSALALLADSASESAREQL